MDLRFTQHRPTRVSARLAQRGFSLWELAILLGLLGLGMAAGFVFLKAQEINQRETRRTHLLAAADRAVINFVAINSRLPCPDSVGNGLENCAPGVHKGWLPAATLGLDASAPARGVTRLRYIAYRGAGADLTTAVDRFNPARWNYYASPSAVPLIGTPPVAHFGAYSPAQISVVDLCRGLTFASGDVASAATAHTGTGAALVNVAYALADGGMDLDGTGNLFDGPLNPAATPGLELPTRVADANYDDRVVAHDFADLYDLLNCATASRSLDAMGQAVEVSNEVHSQAESTRLMAIILSAVNGVKALIQTAKLVVSGVALGTAIGVLSTAIGLLTGAIVSCIVLVGCGLIPVYSAAVASAAIGVSFASATVALNAAAVAYHVTATVATSILAQKASAAVDTSSVDLGALLAQVQDEAAKAAVKAAASNIKATTAEGQIAVALASYGQATTAYRDKWHSYNPGFTWRGQPDPNPKPPFWTRPVDVDPGDIKLDAVVRLYVPYGDAKAAAVAAEGQYDTDLKKYNDMLGSNAAAKTDADAAQAALDADPTNVTKQEANKTKQQIYQQTLKPDSLAEVARLLAKRDQSALDKQTAIDARTAAQAPYEAAKTALLAAYTNYGNDDYLDFNIFTPTLKNYGTDAINAMTRAYDAYLTQGLIASEERKVATIDAQNAIDSASAVVSLQDAIAAQHNSGSATAITVLQGGEVILKAADSKGGVQ